ncbi:peptidase M24, structural domain-containing protein [Peziza echinospora]|nr:peptidase M24, structural domain-containing protein [Peziza echinospora]
MRRPTAALNCLRGLRLRALRSSAPATAATIPRPLQTLLPNITSSLRPSARPYSDAVHASDLRFGQPVHETHPHLIAPGDLTPNISAVEYHDRRTALTALLPQNSIAIFPSAALQYRSGPVFHEFHQDPDFLYLTGWLEPSAACGIIESLGPVGDGEYRFWMFVPEKDQKREQWDGPSSGTIAARDVWNADEARDVGQLEKVLKELLSGGGGGAEGGRRREVYLTHTPTMTAPSISSSQLTIAQIVSKTVHYHPAAPPMIHPLTPLTHSLRLRKSEGEVKNMRIAGKIAGRVYNQMMARKWRSEKELWAFLDYGFKMGGADREAYLPVVAGGANACHLHWTRNNELFRENEMVLIDAGAQYSNYITDISRTFPLAKSYTPLQASLYQAVLTVQKHLLAHLSNLPPGGGAGATSLNTLHALSKHLLTAELRQLATPRFPNLTESLVDSTLYPHFVGHYIGLDVHDCKTVRNSIELGPGMCIAVEPGLYVPYGDERCPKELWGMGVRVEDSVALLEGGGIKVLSVEAVKEVVDVEALRAQAWDLEGEEAEGGRGGLRYPVGAVWPQGQV